jgi:hypothetical protein
VPTFIRPARAEIVEGGAGIPWEMPAAVAAGAAGVWAVVTFVVAWWPVILGGTVAAGTLTALSVRALRRRTVLVWHSQVALPPRAAQTLSAGTANRVTLHAERPVAIEAPRTIPAVVLSGSLAELRQRDGEHERQTADSSVEQHSDNPS